MSRYSCPKHNFFTASCLILSRESRPSQIMRFDGWKPSRRPQRNGSLRSMERRSVAREKISITPPCRERLGMREQDGGGEGQNEGEVERDCRYPGTASRSGARRVRRHHRCHGMSERYCLKDHRQGRRLRARPEGESQERSMVTRSSALRSAWALGSGTPTMITMKPSTAITGGLKPDGTGPPPISTGSRRPSGKDFQPSSWYNENAS